mgnify:CR=1 FL=1
MAALLISWVFAGWLSLVFGLAGIQLLTSFLEEDKRDLLETKIDYVLLFGFILITTLTSILTFFSPINGYVTGAFALAGCGLSYLHWKDLRQIPKNISVGWRNTSWPLKLAIVTAFVLSMGAIVIEFGESDIWFYHSQAIKWIKEYAIVPGLGNIHGRFAFNSHFFISSALFTLWFSEEYVVFSLNSLFFFLLTTRLLININNALREKRWIFFLLNSILVLTCTFQIFPITNGTSTDAASSIFMLYAILLFIERTFNEKTITELVIFWALFFTACTFKLSAVFIGFLLLFHLPLVFRQRKRVLLLLATGMFILLPFITRNVLLSGYLVYPVPSLDVLSVDWKIPIEEVILEKELIEGWSKLPYGGADMDINDIPNILDVPFGEWFREWWPTRSLKWQSIMIIDLFTIVLMFFALFKRNYKLALIGFTIFFNLAFWFIKTPNPRFGFAFLFLGVALVFAHLLQPVFKYFKPNQYIFVLYALLMVLTSVFKNGTEYTEDWKLTLLLIPEYVQVSTPPEPFQARNFTLNLPPSEPPAKGIWCYNLPLPCTPFPKETLVMRGKDFQAGFRVEQ